MFKSSYMVMPLVEQLKIRTQSFRLLGYRSAATKKKSYVLSIGAITGIAWWAISNSRPALTEPSEDIREPASMNMEKVLSGLADPNSRIAVRDKPTASLILSFAIYKACSVKWLVDMAPSIISYASAMHLTKPLNFIIRHTVFDQFLGGESSDDCKNTMVRLNNHGIGVILALSVETDVAEVQEIDKSHFSKEVNQKADQIMNATKQCVMSASTQPGSFIALKISALTSPLLLQKVTSILSQLYESFDQHASAQAMSQSQLCHVVAQHRGLINVEENVPEIVHNHNEIDIVEFKHSLLLHRPVVMNLLSGVLSEQDRQDWLQMLRRLNEICSLARSCGVKVLIDAEQSYLQLAIDQAAQVMEQQHNQLGNCPTIYNTYQMYTKSALHRLTVDIEVAERYNYGHGVKMVRGAYMVMERKRAAEIGYSDPIHDSLKDTHESYHAGIRLILNKLQATQEQTGSHVCEKSSPLSLVIASHNRHSIIYTCKELHDRDIPLNCGVIFFGQLYGMCDDISYTLSRYKLPVYKYLPYGEMEQVVPYLIRRFQENSAIMERTNAECVVIVEELKHRLLDKCFLGKQL
ncbi:unnamed protein product [Umbelopsis vinacea]